MAGFNSLADHGALELGEHLKRSLAGQAPSIDSIFDADTGRHSLVVDLFAETPLSSIFQSNARRNRQSFD